MKKKVLIFIEDGSFTYDNRVIREANALEEAGWDITVICQKYPDDPFYMVINENQRAYYYPNLTAKSAIGHIVEQGISLTLGLVLTAWVSLRHGFSVFHACNPMDILWMIALPFRIAGKKFIFDQHDLCPELYLSKGEGSERSFFYKALLLLERYSYKFSDVVIATNESYKETAVTRGGKKPGDVFVVRNGPDLRKFTKRVPAEEIKKEGDVLVGYLGNMNIQDGVDYLLEAAKIAIKERNRNNIRFVFIGGGSHQPYLSQLTKDMGLTDHVLFTGRLPDDEMLSTLSACDICVQPDPLNPLNDKSTMNKVMEYMALEKPVVTFDLKETRVSCGDAALYATPNDTAELAEKIIFLADSPDIRDEMAKAGRERVEKYLAWEYSVPNLLAAYQHTIK